jgi:hypothetical protein
LRQPTKGDNGFARNLTFNLKLTSQNSFGWYNSGELVFN